MIIKKIIIILFFCYIRNMKYSKVHNNRFEQINQSPQELNRAVQREYSLCALNKFDVPLEPKCTLLHSLVAVFVFGRVKNTRKLLFEYIIIFHR